MQPAELRRRGQRPDSLDQPAAAPVGRARDREDFPIAH
jgi:hypothetical protein